MSSSIQVVSSETQAYFDRLETQHAITEKTLNFAGYTPFTCAFGGLPRILLGLIDIVRFSVQTPFSLIADLFSKPPEGAYFRSSKYFIYVIHAAGNVTRGVIELFPFVINNIGLLCYDHIVDGRIKYSVEYKQDYIDPYIAIHRWLRDKFEGKPSPQTP